MHGKFIGLKIEYHSDLTSIKNSKLDNYYFIFPILTWKILKINKIVWHESFLNISRNSKC